MTPIKKTDRGTIKNLPPCVYCLYMESIVVYVGQTVNLKNRLNGHDSSKVYDSYSYTTDLPNGANNTEAFLIVKHMPLYNKSLPVNDLYLGFTRMWDELLSTTRDVFNDNAHLEFASSDDKRGIPRYASSEVVEQFKSHIRGFVYNG